MPDAVLAALRAASHEASGRSNHTDGVWLADDEPILPGVRPRYMAAPGSTAEAAAVLRAAAAHDLAVVVGGGLTKQDWAAPPRRCDLLLSTRRLTGVVEHAAGDLIAVVRAGTRLTELAELLAPAGQQLALDAPLSGATVGGTVAVSTSGPRRMLYGTVRDLLIGVTVVRPDGAVAHAGGKVVKNVAGYDLGKLITGSYGTLGLVTEAAFRLHPCPAASAYVSRRAADPADAARLVAGVLAGQVVPSALEIDAPAEGGLAVVVLLEGTANGVAGRAVRTTRLLGGDAAISDAPPGWWSAYPWGPGDVGMKLTAALSGVPALLTAALTARRQHGVPLALRGSAGTGVLYAGLPGTTRAETVAVVVDALRAAAGAAGGHAVVLTAPAAVRERVDLWGPVEGLELMRRVKRQFDPDARFAPGRFVGGI
ncbi:glycolate oxidase FAD binding subunit [Micromonospora pattaloongensis]|uniref:Glycolate oxidase FAD binding subunit n=1 Tax=Micromonospora pattaloongensis TaxID=405436 RepID=A0A1H3LVI4_9ACTN|nr:FAD-binding oxidoreductase [Micromonospora pattaloongensis]SDY68366.1 glycolate oxidase FAD binding subunit [Micromonospora pattaloongensis]